MLERECVVRRVHQFVIADPLHPFTLAVEGFFHEIVRFQFRDKLVPGAQLCLQDLGRGAAHRHAVFVGQRLQVSRVTVHRLGGVGRRHGFDTVFQDRLKIRIEVLEERLGEQELEAF